MARGLPVSTVPAGRGPRTTNPSCGGVERAGTTPRSRRDRAPPNQSPADTVGSGPPTWSRLRPRACQRSNSSGSWDSADTRRPGPGERALSRHGAPGLGASQGQGRGGRTNIGGRSRGYVGVTCCSTGRIVVGWRGQGRVSEVYASKWFLTFRPGPTGFVRS